MRRIFLVSLFYILMTATVFSQQNTIKIPFTTQGAGLLHINVVLNNSHNTLFIFDTGASGVTLNISLFNTLLLEGSVSTSDIVGTMTAVLADGSKVTGKIVRLKSLTAGDLKINNVNAFVMPDPNAPLLIGQSVINKFGKVLINYESKEIILEKLMTNTTVKPNIIAELRFIPCSQINIKEVDPLANICKKTLFIDKISEETNVPPPQRSTERINAGITIRYFDNDGYQTALKLEGEIVQDNRYRQYDVFLENMLPYYSYKAIPGYFEVWIK